MKYSGPVRFILKGNTDLAMKYTSRSRLLLQQAMDRMGPDKAYWIRELPDGTKITVSSMGGVHQAWIDVTGLGEDVSLRGYMIETTEGTKYLPKIGGYTKLITLDAPTGPEEWNGSDSVMSASGDIYRAGETTEVDHSARYAFLNDGNYLSLDYGYTLYNGNEPISTEAVTPQLVKVVASPDGSKIATLNNYPRQFAERESIYEYSINLNAAEPLTRISTVPVNSWHLAPYTSENPPPVVEVTGDPTTAWKVQKVTSGGCSYGGVPLESVYTYYDTSTSRKSLTETVDYIFDIEYMDNNRIGVAGISELGFLAESQLVEYIEDGQTVTGIVIGDVSVAVDWCNEYPDAPVGSILSEVETVAEWYENYTDSRHTTNYYGTVKIGDLEIRALDEKSFRQVRNDTPEYGIPSTTVSIKNGSLIVRTGLAWSIKSSTCIYAETVYKDFHVSTYPGELYSNRIVVKTLSNEIVVWSDEDATQRLVTNNAYDLIGVYPQEQRNFVQVANFFDQTVFPGSKPLVGLTLSYADRHSDANSDLLIVKGTLYNGDPLNVAFDCTGKGANNIPQKLLEDEKFISFTAI